MQVGVGWEGGGWFVRYEGSGIQVVAHDLEEDESGLEG